MKRINNLKASLTKTLLLILSVCTTAAMIISANSVVSPWNGQPTPPDSLRKYRRF